MFASEPRLSARVGSAHQDEFTFNRFPLRASRLSVWPKQLSDLGSLALRDVIATNWWRGAALGGLTDVLQTNNTRILVTPFAILRLASPRGVPPRPHASRRTEATMIPIKQN
jgi:hypothetical protein